MPRCSRIVPPHHRRILCACLLAFAAGCASPPESGDTALAPEFEQLLDAVVRIDVREASFESGTRRIERGVGSGVILSADGLILTNAHVVSPQAVDIQVTLASLERVDARLLGWDHWTDLALIQIDMEAIRRRGLSFAHARLGDSDRLRAGHTVYAVGTPNGLTRTVTRGIISNPTRYFAATAQIRGHETGYFNNWLQTDAAINPGNSGGPLADPSGRVVGINTRSYLGANNLSFAVPANTAAAVLDALRRTGAVTRSYIGIRPAPLQDLESFFGLDVNEGVLVDSVDPGSPAAHAGMRAGDILLRLDGQALDGRFPEQLPPILHGIASRPVGSTLSLTIRRGGETRDISLVTEALESRVGAQWAFASWGMSVQEISRTIARERQLASADGLIVIGIQPAFPADEAGLQRGDVLLSANRQPIRNLDDLRAVHAAFISAPERVLFEVMRNHQVVLIVLRPSR